MGSLLARGVLPFVVGGTGLYIKALIYVLFEAPVVDEALRRHLRWEVDQVGAPALHRRLAQLDPRAAGRIHPNDAFRITRALEVLETTGHSISSHQQAHGFKEPLVDALRGTDALFIAVMDIGKTCSCQTTVWPGSAWVEPGRSYSIPTRSITSFNL